MPKLTYKQVASIRKLYPKVQGVVTQTTLATCIGITQGELSKLVNNKTRIVEVEQTSDDVPTLFKGD